MPSADPRGWRGLALEAAVATAAAALFLASCLTIHVYAMDRIGQISGLASLGLRFVLFAIALVTALVIASRREGASFSRLAPLACAALAGVASGMVAGGILVALHGTPFGLNGRGGDAGAIASWTAGLARGEPLPATYPPLSIHILYLYGKLVHLPPELALKHLEIAGTAALGPIAYMSWRMLLRPGWALAIGVVSALPLYEPYKPYPNLVLVVFVPLAIVYLDVIRNVAGRSTTSVVRAGAGYGIAFGLLCLMYSGWYEWALPGLVVATAVLLPWRTAPRKAWLLLGVTAAVFLVVAGVYLHGLLFDPAGKIADSYIYFDVKTDPMYIAMWRNDTPGILGVWPPIGELGGVGLFTLLLAVGLGFAVALGRKTTHVIGIGSMILGAWVMRFFYAHRMFDTKLVQLYPRTTPLILYGLLALGGLAVYWLVERLAADHPLRSRSATIGAVCALLFVFASSGSALSDRYMPVNSDPPGPGWLTYNAHAAEWAERPVYTWRPLVWVRRPQ
jgi:galactan 5-O-arabinofuranosyltransferase